jgi:hypothetical protein
MKRSFDGAIIIYIKRRKCLFCGRWWWWWRAWIGRWHLSFPFISLFIPHIETTRTFFTIGYTPAMSLLLLCVALCFLGFFLQLSFDKCVQEGGRTHEKRGNFLTRCNCFITDKRNEKTKKWEIKWWWQMEGHTLKYGTISQLCIEEDEKALSLSKWLTLTGQKPSRNPNIEDEKERIKILFTVHYILHIDLKSITTTPHGER